MMVEMLRWLGRDQVLTLARPCRRSGRVGKLFGAIPTLLLSLCVSAQAQLSGGVGGFPGPGTAHSVGVSYTGPGDVQGSAGGYWSCTRAYTAAYATGLGNACDLVRASDSASCTMVFLASGDADVATTNSCSTGTQTVTQFCNATTCRVSQAYDQSGNGRHATQATSGTRPTFDPAGAKVMVFAGSQGLTITGAIVAQVYSISAVAQRTSGSANVCLFCATANQGMIYSSAGNAGIFAPTVATAAAVNSVCHALQGILNGASSSLMVDGSANTGLSAGAQSTSTPWGIGSSGTVGSLFLTGTVREVIFYPSNISANQSALSTNQTNYGGC